MCTTFWSRNSSHLIHGLHILRPKFGVLRGSIASTVEKRCTKMSGGLGLAMLHSVAVPESSLGDTTSQGTACACVHLVCTVAVSTIRADKLTPLDIWIVSAH